MYSGQNNDNHYVAELGSRISCPNSLYALLDHLDIDSTISITEPVANIVKGQLPVAGADLSYTAKSADIEKLRGVQINTIIKEIDGVYFIDQLTAYKSASKLSRINVVKVIHRMRKDLPKLLKDLLQRKALENIILAAKSRTEQYMSRWLVTDNNTVDGIFSEIEVTPVFIEEELKLIISIAVRPIGTIEKIEVPITVY
jgi:DNA polymerase III delta prime subunit